MNLDQHKRSTKWRFREVCFIDLGSCSLSLSALDSDAQYSRSDPSDLDMVKIEAKLPLYDHDSRSDSSCSEKDDFETLTFVFGH